jgi:putative ABC transport system permease protein
LRTIDTLRYAGGALSSNRMRSFLTGLGIAIGIAAVVLLTSIGEGVQRYIISEFTQFGTNLIAIVPGKTATHGFSSAVISNVRPLAIEDELALRPLPGVVDTVSVVQGNAEVEAGRRQRRVTVLGTGAGAPAVWRFKCESGGFLPADDPRYPRALAVLGSKVRQELFPGENPLGSTVRVGGSRFRVVGVMEAKGQILGFDLDDSIYIPTAKALELFNRQGVMEIDILYREQTLVSELSARIKQKLIARHGSEDFTINTQEQMLSVLDDLLGKLTLAVGALGGISLLVGGVGILTIMTIAVHDRTSEIGLLRAIGASRGQVLTIFLLEAVTLAAVGGVVGLMVGYGTSRLLHTLLPALPSHTPWRFALLAEILSAVIGLMAGILPARRAARLDPIEALRAE